jgi:hypothetical protein
MFEWDVLAAYVLFIEPDDMMRAWNWIRGRLGVEALQRLWTFRSRRVTTK